MPRKASMYCVTNGSVVFFSDNLDELKVIAPTGQPKESNITVFDENLPNANKGTHFEIVLNKTTDLRLQFYPADYSSLIFEIRKSLRNSEAQGFSIHSQLTSILLTEIELREALAQLVERQDIAEAERAWHEANKTTVSDYYRRLYGFMNPWFMTAQGVLRPEILA